MPYSIDKFEVNAQYAGFYQNIIKRDFVSSKLFIFLCAFTFTASLISISYLSNLDHRKTHSVQRFVSAPELVPISKPEAAPTKMVQAETEKLENTQKIPVIPAEKQLDVLMLKPTPPAKILANDIKPPQLLPAIPNLGKVLEAKKPETRTTSGNLAVVDFKIKKSLLKDTKQVGLSRYLTNELTHAFAEKLDIRKVRPGDRFTVLYNKQQGKKIKGGQILAAKYTSRNKVIKVVRLSEGPHKGAFFSLDKLYEGAAPKLTLSLLRKPVKSGRVSSPFQAHRFHPILKRYRAHLGVDYAAAPGSPIIASGNGKVTFVGYQHGYGNLVIIQHDSKYSTRYGHMARFAKIKPGTPVKQGQVIGFVGRTGYATGHHVHYEIRVNGKAYNPLTVALPNMRKALPAISKQRRQEIVSKARVLFAKMDELNKNRKNG